jgi:hypothetical protein
MPSIRAKTLREIYDGIGGLNTPLVAFMTAGKLRNTTGHNLVWDDVFSEPEIFVELFHQVMNAILYVVDVKEPKKPWVAAQCSISGRNPARPTISA